MIIHPVSYISIQLHQRSITTAPTLHFLDRGSLLVEHLVPNIVISLMPKLMNLVKTRKNEGLILQW